MNDLTVNDILILVERILQTKLEGLSEPLVTLDRLPGYRVVRDMTETQKVMYDLRTRLIREAKGWASLAEEAKNEGNQEQISKATKNLEDATALIILLGNLLRTSYRQQGISDLLQGIEFISGWKIAVGPKLGDSRPDPDGQKQAIVAADLHLKAINHGLQGIGQPNGRPRKKEEKPN